MSRTCKMLLIAICLLIMLSNSYGEDKSVDNIIYKPFGIRWHVFGDSLILSWLYCENAKPPDGFYIKLQEFNSDGTMKIPEFVHVKDPESLSIDIHGLKPATKYFVKVVAYSKDHSRSSKGIEVSTKKLALLKVNSFDASAITDTSAVFKWSHEINNLINDMQFKIACSGESRYHENDEEKTEMLNVEYLTDNASLRSEHYKVTDLVPNTVYVCGITAIAKGVESEPHSSIEFLTLPGKPIPPAPPRVIVSTPEKPLPHSSFEVDLFDTNDMNGPISHYIIFAVPVTRGRNAPQSMPFTPVIPLDKLLSKAVTARLASTVTDRLPFVIGVYEPYNLPKKLIFDGRFNHLDFKPDTYYAFVTAAFTDTHDSDDVKYSLSSPSSPPVYIGPDMTAEWVKERKPAAERFGAIVILTLIAVIVTLSLLVFILVGLAYMRRKQFGTLTFDHDSEGEVEIYQSGALKKNGVKIQSPRRQTQNKKPYHILETDESGRFQMKTPVDKIKSSNFNELESMPELYSTPPPDSSYHPTSPLIRSRREEIHLPNPNNRISPKQSPRQLSPNSTPRPTSLQRYNDYLESSVATNINTEDDNLAYRQPLPKRKPYSPPPNPRANTSGGRHPPIGPPAAPPPTNSVRIGIREGYKVPEATQECDDPLMRELQDHETYIRQSYVLQNGRRKSIQRYSSMPSDEIDHLDETILKTTSAMLPDELVLVDEEELYMVPPDANN